MPEAVRFEAGRRSRAPEWMDGDDVSDAEMAACLADLARVNRLLRATRPTLGWLGHATRGWAAGRAFHLVDVGAGEGDMLRAIARWAARRGLAARLEGYDLNPRCTVAARRATDPALGIAFITGDAMEAEERPDFIISALVTHHMADDAIARFVAWMDRTARAGWFVNDLHRHRLAFHGFALLSAITRWHPMVAHDGRVSVARGFVAADWARLLAAAGVTADVAWWLPFRWGVGAVKR